MQFREGEVFARYRIESLLGQGGMGQVYAAYDTVLRRRVALKLLRPTGTMAIGATDAAAQLLREARAAAALNHRSCVAIFDVGEVAGTPFIAMELVEGKTLRAYVGDQAVALEKKLAWLVDVAHVLGAAHAAGLVHRDIKPENVMVCTDGTIKLLDFGIAKRPELEAPTSTPLSSPAPSSSSFHTAAGVVRGTLKYMAPERLVGAPFDGRSDQFAWGLVAYELLSGHHPWTGGIEELLTRAPPPLLNEMAPGIPFDVAAAVARALAYEPHMRFSTMEDLAQPIEPFVAQGSKLRERSSPSLTAEDEPTVAMPLAERDSGTSDERRQPPRRARAARLAWIAGTCFVSVSIAAAVMWRGPTWRAHTRPGPVASASASSLPPASGPPLVLILGFENQTTDPVFEGTLELVLESSLKWSPVVYPFAGSQARVLVAELAPNASGDEELGRVVAARTGRPITIVRGAVAADGSGFMLSFRAVDGRSSAAVATSSMKAETAARVVPTVARFASALRAALGDPPRAEDLERCGMSTSLEADHEVAEARAELNTGKVDLALSHYQKAVDIDPRFAIAQTMLGIALNNIGRASEAEAPLRAALANEGELSERDRLQFRAFYHFGRDEFGESAAADEELLARWPADTRHLGNLAAPLFANGDLVRGREVARRAVQEHPSSVINRANLIGFELVSGDFQSAADETRSAMNRAAHSLAETYAYGALAAAMLGHRDETLDLYRRLKESDPSAAVSDEADFAAFEGRLADAAAALEAGIATDEEHKASEEAKSKWATLAETRLRQGRSPAARSAAVHAAASGEILTLYRAARVLIGTGGTKEAAAIAERIARRPGERARLTTRLLAGESLRASGAATRSVPAFQSAGDAWIVHAELGGTYLELGELADAERELEICVARRGEGLTAFLDNRPTARYLPPVLYDLARAKDAQHRADAVDAYKAFLAMDDGENDPLVRDAHRRVAGR